MRFLNYRRGVSSASILIILCAMLIGVLAPGVVTAAPAVAVPGAPQSGGVYHTVRPGDTLSGLARWYGTTVQAIMQANGLRSTTIYVGQALYIPSGGGGGGGGGGHTCAQYHYVQRGDTLSGIARWFGVSTTALAQANGIANPSRIYVGQRLRLRPPPGGVVARPAARPSSPPAVRALPQSLPAAPPWTWPVLGGRVAGQVTQPSGGVGLRIDGALGQPVLAAADGKVVYTGTGLHGYGVVIIINHVNGWLTAYGHNATVEVTEGDAVKAGQRIATMGEGVGQQPMLYFEIRIEGTPVDPLTQLPRR